MLSYKNVFCGYRVLCASKEWTDGRTAFLIGILQGRIRAGIAEVDCLVISVCLIGMFHPNELQFHTYMKALSTSICAKGL